MKKYLSYSGGIKNEDNIYFRVLSNSDILKISPPKTENFQIKTQEDAHQENTPIQIYRKFHLQKLTSKQKKSGLFTTTY